LQADDSEPEPGVVVPPGDGDRSDSARSSSRHSSDPNLSGTEPVGPPLDSPDEAADNPSGFNGDLEFLAVEQEVDENADSMSQSDPALAGRIVRSDSNSSLVTESDDAPGDESLIDVSSSVPVSPTKLEENVELSVTFRQPPPELNSPSNSIVIADDEPARTYNDNEVDDNSSDVDF
jgi:hypothetical protein